MKMTPITHAGGREVAAGHDKNRRAGEHHVTFKVVRMDGAPKLVLRFREIQLEPAQ